MAAGGRAMHRGCLRGAAATLVVVCCWVTIAFGAPNHTPQQSTLLTCHDDVLDAARTLTAAVEDHLGRCLTHGLDCLVSTSDPAQCCEQKASRCDDDLTKIRDAELEFERLV